MKKILGIFVAVTLCICMLVPAVSAADTSSITSLIESLGVDLGDKGLSNSELSSILGSLDLEGFDTKSIKTALDNGDSSKLGEIENALKSLEAAPASTEGSAAGGSGSPLDSISGLLGGFDLSSIASGDMLSSLTGMFEGVDMSSFDVSALMDTISGAFGENGIDLGSITEGMDMGDFDISSILGSIGGGYDTGSAAGSGDAAAGATDTISSIMDSLTSGLGSLGLDTSAIEGLLDNDVVNTIADLFIGLGDTLGISGGDDSSDVATTKATTTTTTPAVVTSKTPKTGDTSTALIALGTFSVAAAAAFVCLKKKEN
ncbi:MAG: LPXTG cell wall anchor domain-containing protein [Faecalibacterium sp.]|nr:LPXTG cell wall anchor domain-containing protein [Ruminococcus sp.]MCM1393214.1 LPXTG cell wall anchor domain-containing protein [Ruminococcus sp.]MCM1486383.1 LPXTG cell wall anchor domain-containing protein [Faecalibacterium sp.]